MQSSTECITLRQQKEYYVLQDDLSINSFPQSYYGNCYTSVKKLKDFNDDCKDLNCESEVVTEEDGITFLCNHR